MSPDHAASLTQAPVDLDQNWARLRDWVGLTLPKPEALLYHDLLDSLRDDLCEGGVRKLLGFRRAPAAQGNHHAYEGGLVAHLLEMWSLWLKLRDQFQSPPHVTDERVLKAIILHDLHKAHRTYELLETDPWRVTYCNDDTDMLMTSDVKSLWLAQRAGICLDPEQINALLWAEGGFSKVKPQWCSVLAKVCYTLDELSGNGLSRIRSRTFLSHRRTEPASD